LSVHFANAKIIKNEPKPNNNTKKNCMKLAATAFGIKNIFAKATKEKTIELTPSKVKEIA
jgi:hypothetical protein